MSGYTIEIPEEKPDESGFIINFTEGQFNGKSVTVSNFDLSDADDNSGDGILSFDMNYSENSDFHETDIENSIKPLVEKIILDALENMMKLHDNQSE